MCTTDPVRILSTKNNRSYKDPPCRQQIGKKDIPKKISPCVDLLAYQLFPESFRAFTSREHVYDSLESK